MNEKKLDEVFVAKKAITDDEIVRAYKCCFIDNIDCDDCPCEDWGCGVKREDILGVIERLKNENECLKAKDKLNQMDIADLHAERERRVEEVYADFTQDYKIMRDELNECQKDYIELDLQCRKLRTELDKELAEHEEFVKRASEEVESLKSKSSFKNSWKNKFFKAQEEVERLTEENGYLDGCAKQFLADYQNAQVQVDELRKRLIDEFEAFKVEAYGKVKQQSVKDTAKEIYRKAEKKAYFKDGGHYDKDRYLLDMTDLKGIVNGYGVEVE